MKNPDLQSESSTESKTVVRQFAMPLTVLLLMLAISRYAVDYWPAIESYIAQLGSSGYILFSLVFIVLTSLCFPVSLMGISAGVLFGPYGGFLLVAFSNLASGLLMLALGRTFLRSRIKTLLVNRPKLAAVDRMAGKKAFRLNLLTRLSPLNYGLACYTLASGRTSTKAYTLGLLGILPGVVLQVGFGVVAQHSGNAFSSGNEVSTLQVLGLGIGVIFFITLSAMVGKMVKEAMADPSLHSTDQTDRE